MSKDMTQEAAKDPNGKHQSRSQATGDLEAQRPLSSAGTEGSSIDSEASILVQV